MDSVSKFNPNHDSFGRFARSAGDGGGVPKKSGSKKQVDASTKRTIDENTKKVVDLIRQDKGDETAKRLEPIVRESFKQFLSGDPSKPLVVNGKKIMNGDTHITANDFLDSIADVFGTEAVTGISGADFASGDAFRRVVKANPYHDERGRFTSGRSAVKVSTKTSEKNMPSQLKALALQGGFTFNPRRNEMRRKGIAVAVSKNTELVVGEKEFAKNGEKIVSGYLRKHSEILSQPEIHVGAWKDKGKVYLDLSRVTKSVSEAANVGRANDQIGLFDLSTFTTWTRLKHPVTGETKYFPKRSVSESESSLGIGGEPSLSNLGIVIDGSGGRLWQFGKSDTGVVYVPVDSLLDASNIKLFVDKVLSMSQINKAEPTSSDVHLPTIMNNQKKRKRRTKKMMVSEVVEKKERLKDPKGGLTAAGRRKYNRETGSNLKPGVRGKADTPEKMRRKGSFLTRFFTNPSGPMKDEKGRPTRLALSAAAWGEPVPSDRAAAARLAAKGRRLLERYDKVKKDEELEKFNPNHDSLGRFTSGSGRTVSRPKALRARGGKRGIYQGLKARAMTELTRTGEKVGSSGKTKGYIYNPKTGKSTPHGFD